MTLVRTTTTNIALICSEKWSNKRGEKTENTENTVLSCSPGPGPTPGTGLSRMSTFSSLFRQISDFSTTFGTFSATFWRLLRGQVQEQGSGRHTAGNTRLFLFQNGYFRGCQIRLAGVGVLPESAEKSLKVVKFALFRSFLTFLHLLSRIKSESLY